MKQMAFGRQVSRRRLHIFDECCRCKPGAQFFHSSKPHLQRRLRKPWHLLPRRRDATVRRRRVATSRRRSKASDKERPDAACEGTIIEAEARSDVAFKLNVIDLDLFVVCSPSAAAAALLALPPLRLDRRAESKPGPKWRGQNRLGPALHRRGGPGGLRGRSPRAAL